MSFVIDRIDDDGLQVRRDFSGFRKAFVGLVSVVVILGALGPFLGFLPGVIAVILMMAFFAVGSIHGLNDATYLLDHHRGEVVVTRKSRGTQTYSYADVKVTKDFFEGKVLGSPQTTVYLVKLPGLFREFTLAIPHEDAQRFGDFLEKFERRRIQIRRSNEAQLLLEEKTPHEVVPNGATSTAGTPVAVPTVAAREDT